MSESQPAKCYFCPNTSYMLNLIEQDGEIVLLCDDCLVEEPHKP